MAQRLVLSWRAPTYTWHQLGVVCLSSFACQQRAPLLVLPISRGVSGRLLSTAVDSSSGAAHQPKDAQSVTDSQQETATHWQQHTTAGPKRKLPPDYNPKNRFQIRFTCTAKKCNTRNIKSFSHAAYYCGVVIITCEGCGSKHLIADNLGIFGDERNIQEILAKKGVTMTTVPAGSVPAGKTPAADTGASSSSTHPPAQAQPDSSIASTNSATEDMVLPEFNVTKTPDGTIEVFQSDDAETEK
eukprot:gb/GEZN01010902.1/.p1 GENE.gb/GEZN01010902.1/~~gb/GEZN01010902.1/.p1  ORF type:complete len:243 (+),score=40.62 gb/GEZN01010902.1/:152-880(+)